MKIRWISIGIAAALIALVGGGVYYTRNRPVAGGPQRSRDPGLTVLFAIRTLERNEDTRLSREQIARILPFVKTLKDVPLSDEAGGVIARAIRDAFTPQQQAALEEARRQFQQAQRQGPASVAFGGGDGGGTGVGGAPGAGGPPGGGLSDEQRAQFRTRSFERMIRYLERRMQ